MKPMEPRKYGAQGPESKIQDGIVSVLRTAEWFVQVFIGNAYQFGVPDLFAAHPSYGPKWIEVKYIPNMSFTAKQQITFPKMHAAGVGIWILTAYTPEEMLKLSKPANWLPIYTRWLMGG